MSPYTFRAGISGAAATFFVALLTIVPSHGSNAQVSAQPVQAVSREAKRSLDRSEARLAELHDRLHITAAQEPLWTPVAQAMRDSATALRANMTGYLNKPEATAVDDLKSFQIIADEHSNGLKKVIPAFEALYATMTPAQQKRTDHVFSEHRRQTGL